MKKNKVILYLAGLLSEADFHHNDLHRTASIALFCDKKLLLLRRGSTAPWMPLRWALTGGGIEENETPSQAAAREAHEEIGINISPNQLQEIMTKPDPDEGYIMTVHYHETKNPTVNLNYEHDQYKWCSYDECQKLNLVPNLMTIINVLKNKGYFGNQKPK